MNIAPSTERLRRSLDEPASAVRQAVAVSRGAVSIAFLDVTGVNVVNRELGRDAGDLLLRAFEDRLTESGVGSHEAWRLGGDEYVLLLPRRSARSSVHRLRVLRRQMARAAVMLTPTQRAVLSFRAGGATTLGATGTAWDLYVAAGQALQRARRYDVPIVWHSIEDVPKAYFRAR